MNILRKFRKLFSSFRLYSLILVPVLAFSFVGYKVFNVDATTVPTFQGYLGQTPTAGPGDHLAGFAWPTGVTVIHRGICM
jgi:hypothetical protein